MMKNYRVAMMKSFTEFKAYTSIGVLCFFFFFFVVRAFLGLIFKKKSHI